MSESVSLRRRLARALMRCATIALPATRADWASAMNAELDHFDSDHDASVWAIGCVVAALRERANVVFIGNLKVSRWILAPEMLLCFVPLTVLWLDAIGGSSGIIRLNGDVIQRYFLDARGGKFALVTMIAGVILGTLGPLGLTAAFRLIVFGRTPSSRWFRTALVAGPILYGILTLITRVAIGGTGSLRFEAVVSFDLWSSILLLSALPSLGAAHMLRLVPQSLNERFAAS
jgi:hypothetical protein